jgi:DNA primase
VARIADTSVEAVKAAADVVEVISGRTQLKRSGARFTGLCPFHDERTPSFSVSPEKGTYYCFGCQRGGDTISFVEETEGVDFVGAIEWLAQRFNVPLEYEEASPEQDAKRRHRERLYAVLDGAAAFYERYLWESQAGREARAYLETRGLAEGVCREYRLGLAAGGATLARKAGERGFTRQELTGAGLLNRRGNDYFQGRLLFPIADARARVVGFQARRLREDDPLQAKYVNSPEGELFRKGDLLYGLDRARTAIAREERALIVEGNTDVLALRQAGLGPVVASMGTALTERQLKELSRLTRKLYLCFDADAAGEAATLRGMDLAGAQGFDVRVVALPAGADPADDPASFALRLATADPYPVHRVRLELDREPDRLVVHHRVEDFLNRIPDSPERHDAWRLANDRLGTTIALRATGAAAGATSGPVSPKLLEAGERLERDALAGASAHPELRALLAELSPDHFDSDLHRRAREHLLEPGEADRDLIQLLAELDARADAEGIDDATTKELLLNLHERKLRRELQNADFERTKELQEELERLRSATTNLV